MGTYLSTPVLEKGDESSGDAALNCPVSPLAWGVVDMQGWRKTMEDAHVAATDILIPPHLLLLQQQQNSNQGARNDNKDNPVLLQHSAKVFGVFDGHGGPEVARFCQLYMVDVLTQMASWKQQPQQQDAAASSPSTSTTTNVDPVGQALISAFHALDIMIDDAERRDELIRLRTDKPKPGERRTTMLTLPDDFYGGKPSTQQPSGTSSSTNGNNKNNDTTIGEDDNMETTTDEEQDPPQQQGEQREGVDTSNDSTNNKNDSSVATTESPKKESQGKQQTNSDDIDDDDSDQAVGYEEAAELDRFDDGDVDNDEIVMEDDDGVEVSTTGVAEQEQQQEQEPVVSSQDMTLIREFLISDDPDGGQVSIARTRSGQVEIQVTGIDDLEDDEEDAATENNTNSITSTASKLFSDGPSALVPTLIHNGRQICNLPDHPIHAGCTAVVAVLMGRTLTVANAGDSRAVLCREGGHAEPLSFDHKPLQNVERIRIQKAGGFVNQFGRVNGNLNLSRSIGDLKYKQVPGLSPAEQMITAEPDILQTTLDPNDEFFVLGCDGIWDCLTNDQAIKYVRERIDSKTPTQIGIEMLDDIISEDPRATQGIGGDNMTIMIVDLQPQKRAYR